MGRDERKPSDLRGEDNSRGEESGEILRQRAARKWGTPAIVRTADGRVGRTMRGVVG